VSQAPCSPPPTGKGAKEVFKKFENVKIDMIN